MTLLPQRSEIFTPEAIRRLANLSAFLFFLEILIPQITLIGRPWLIAVTFSVWFLSSLGPELTNTIKRVGPLALLPIASLLITVIKMHASGATLGLHRQYLAGPVYLALATFLCGFYLLNNTRSFQRIRIYSVIILGIITAYSIPLAYNEPGVGRILAMHRPHVLKNCLDPDALVIQGLPGYAIIYTLAMTGLILVSWAQGAKTISRTIFVLFVGALVVLFFHVVLSTLTLAVLVGGTLFVAGLLLAVWCSRIRYRIAVMCGIVLVAIALCSLQPIQFVLAKTFRLTTGMAAQGIKDGDETGRGGLLLESLNTFTENPVWGCNFSDETLPKKIGGHSSMVDLLGMYGALGIIPILLYHFIIVRNGLRTWNANRYNLRGIGELAAWVFYGVCSFWNTTTYSMLPLALLFLQILPPSNPDSSDAESNIGNSDS